jgi:Family of unknown function (DUF5678)
MAEVTLERVLEQARQLPATEQQKLREFLPRPEVVMPEFKAPRIPPGRRVPLAHKQKDRSQELAWLMKNQGDYAGQWVALEGDELIAHGYDLVQVSNEAKAKGVANPIFARAEAPNARPFAGWP